MIIDGYSLLYRAFFATRYLSTSDGRPTNALYGFTQMIFNLIEKEKPRCILVALDAPGKTFRHAEYSEYKGTRKETADELKVQLKAARELIAELGIPSIELTGYEADDVVGTISKLAESNSYDSIIVTGDLDSLQLVDDHVSVMTMKVGVTDTIEYDPAAVIERYGFGPEYVPDFKALKGDTSDNIPGVPGIGDKGAADLIQKFGTIENMLDRKSEIEAKYLKKIDGNEDQMRKSKWLATIVRDAPLEFDFKPFQLNSTKLEGLTAMLEGYEFKSLAKRAPRIFSPYLEGYIETEAESLTNHAETKLEPIVATVEEVQSIGQLIEKLGSEKFGIHAQLAGESSLFGDEKLVVYFSSSNQTGLQRLVLRSPGEVAKQFLQDRLGLAIGHELKPTCRRLKLTSSDFPAFDSALAGFVLQSGRSHYELRDLIQGYTEVQLPDKSEQIAAILPILAEEMTDRLKKESQLSVLDEIELPLIPILAKMEAAGITADRSRLSEFSKQLEAEIAVTQVKVFELAGQEFNIGSPKQLGELLFEKLKLPDGSKTKTGWATGVEVLGKLAAEYPIAEEVLKWRELSKLKSTYADSLERLIADDGRIHTTYNQTGAATGRLSSTDPNLQNIPIRTELGRGIRKAFVAAPGTELLSIDYSQIELRVLAHMCEEPALVTAFQNHEDVHSVTAASIFNLGSEPPSKEQRRVAKMLNYAVLYGVTEFGLAQQLGAGFGVTDARELIRQYNERFPSIAGFTESIVKEARAKSFTTTLCGRRRYFPDIHASRINERKYAERQAMNAPIQGTAADMLKLAMIQVAQFLQGKASRMLLNVHDELVFELRPEERDLVPAIKDLMANALPLKVPVEVDAKIGGNWNEMSPI